MEEKILALIKSLKTRMDNCTEVHEYEVFEAYQYATESLEKILGESRVCKDCGNYFELTDRELAFYQRNKLFLPKRCPNCREVRKAKKTFVADTVSAL